MKKLTQAKRGSNKLSQAENIRQYLKAHPEKSVSEVARIMGLKYQIVYMTKRGMEDKQRKLVKAIKNRESSPPVQQWEIKHVSASDNSVEKEMPVTMHEPAADPVNHPTHYKVGGVETIDFIEAKKLNYNLGNAVKYISRAYYKGNVKQDLQKAVWYLNREIDLFRMVETFRRGENK